MGTMVDEITGRVLAALTTKNPPARRPRVRRRDPNRPGPQRPPLLLPWPSRFEPVKAHQPFEDPLYLYPGSGAKLQGVGGAVRRQLIPGARRRRPDRNRDPWSRTPLIPD